MTPTLILWTVLVAISPAPAPVPAIDPDLARIVQEVSAERIAKNIQTLAGFHTRHTLSDTKDPARGIGAARNWIKQEFESYAKDSAGRLKVEFDVFTAAPNRRIPQPTEVMNVVATLPGADPKAAARIYVVGGHYDSICGTMGDVTCEAPGSNDDASGTSVALECARVLSKRSFPATIVFIAFVGEEQGLIGAHHWAEEAKKQNLKVTMLNNDIVGGNKSAPGKPANDWVRVFSDGPSAKETPEEIRERLAGGGEVDTPQRQLARLNALTLANLALAPGPPENARYLPERGENSTLIAWQPSLDNSSSAEAGYEIVWRDTAAPRWEHSVAVAAPEAGKDLRYRSTELSKDNYFFGVRSVDAKGHRSLVVFPKPPARPAGAPLPVTE